MKKLILTTLAACLTACLFGGCAWEVSGSPKHATVQPTLGQQMIDLQKAKDAGALTDAEYQTQKSKLLGGKN